MSAIAIERGRTGGRVCHDDPAAVPLGTDEEAAGTPAPAQSSAFRLAFGEIRRPSRESSEPAFWPGAAWTLACGALLGCAAWFAL